MSSQVGLAYRLGKNKNKQNKQKNSSLREKGDGKDSARCFQGFSQRPPSTALTC